MGSQRPIDIATLRDVDRLMSSFVTLRLDGSVTVSTFAKAGSDRPPNHVGPFPARSKPTFAYRRARGAVRPAPGSPSSEVLIRRVRDAV